MQPSQPNRHLAQLLRDGAVLTAAERLALVAILDVLDVTAELAQRLPECPPAIRDAYEHGLLICVLDTRARALARLAADGRVQW